MGKFAVLQQQESERHQQVISNMQYLRVRNTKKYIVYIIKLVYTVQDRNKNMQCEDIYNEWMHMNHFCYIEQLRLKNVKVQSIMMVHVVFTRSRAGCPVLLLQEGAT